MWLLVSLRAYSVCACTVGLCELTNQGVFIRLLVVQLSAAPPFILQPTQTDKESVKTLVKSTAIWNRTTSDADRAIFVWWSIWWLLFHCDLSNAAEAQRVIQWGKMNELQRQCNSRGGHLRVKPLFCVYSFSSSAFKHSKEMKCIV